MNRNLFALALALILAPVLSAAEKLPKPLVTGLKNPESVVLGSDGRTYVTTIGEFGTDGDGEVVVIQGDKAVTFAKGLDDPKGIIAFQNFLFVTDKTKVVRIDRMGKVTVLADAKAFPSPPQFLNDIVIDESGTALFVTDSGDNMGGGGAVYRIDAMRGRVSLVVDSKKSASIKTPNGLLLDATGVLLVLDFTSGELLRVKFNGEVSKVAEGFEGGDGLAWDKFGRLFITSWKQGKMWGIPRPEVKPILLAEGLQSAADLCLDKTGRSLLVPDMKAGTLTVFPTTIPGWEVDETPLPIESVVAFPNLKWTGWNPEESGKVVPLRPIVLTHAGDGSNRVFVATQHGVIHVFANDQKATKTEVFLDIQKKVFYDDKQNEEGFLGLAFHPDFKKNGEFFVFYTIKNPKLTNVVCRYRVSKDDPNKADPASEEELLRIKRPFWNHDGGTLCFGPDGYLYIALGDGGAANDPFENGQKMDTLLGKILRIDVNSKDEGKKYAIPKDNPFVGVQGASPEIWALGLRNVWRMAFDRKTGTLWAGEVGQNLWEEINLITKGGNYGWNPRESLHAFGPKGVGPRKEMIDPIWEYHHDIGKSITGGHVYRGERLPELEGHYLYADYVSGLIWGLKYDEEKKRVVANRPIKHRSLAIMSFGEDEKGDVYYMTYTPTGQGIYRFEKTDKPKK